MPQVSPDFHTGVLTLCAGILIALALKRYPRLTTRARAERVLDTLALIVILQPTSGALLGLLTQETSRNAAAISLFFTLAAAALFGTSYFLHVVTSESAVDDEDKEAAPIVVPSPEGKSAPGSDGSRNVRKSVDSKKEKKKARRGRWAVNITGLAILGLFFYIFYADVRDAFAWANNN